MFSNNSITCVLIETPYMETQFSDNPYVQDSRKVGLDIDNIKIKQSESKS
jgi:hypothetical protein